MPRGAPTKADIALIAFAAEAGVPVTRRQIEDWRIAGALPPRTVTSLGRHGRRSQDPPGTAERLLAICNFIYKTGRLAERNDVPRRRKISDALLWIWYAGYDVPAAAIRDQVCARWTAALEELGAIRASTKIANPGLPVYEIEQAAAEAAVENQASTPEFRRLVRGFRKHGRHQADADPAAELLGGFGQVVQMLDSDVEVEPNVLAHLFDLGAHIGQPSDAELNDQWLSLLQDRLSADQILEAFSGLSDAEWEQLRAILHSWNASIIEQEFEPRARAALLIATTAKLVSAIGYLAVLLPELRSGLKERYGIELGN